MPYPRVGLRGMASQIPRPQSAGKVSRHSICKKKCASNQTSTTKLAMALPITLVYTCHIEIKRKYLLRNVFGLVWIRTLIRDACRSKGVTEVITKVSLLYNELQSAPDNAQAAKPAVRLSTNLGSFLLSSTYLSCAQATGMFFNVF